MGDKTRRFPKNSDPQVVALNEKLEGITKLNAPGVQGGLLGHVMINGTKREVRSITVRQYLASGMDHGGLVDAESIIKLTAMALGVSYEEVQDYDYFETFKAVKMIGDAAERML